MRLFYFPLQLPSLHTKLLHRVSAPHLPNTICQSNSVSFDLIIYTFTVDNKGVLDLDTSQLNNCLFIQTLPAHSTQNAKVQIIKQLQYK